MPTEQGTGRRPFHETIVDAIQWTQAGNGEEREVTLLAILIKDTEIPRDHDKIIEAWKGLREYAADQEEYSDVLASLLEQKQEAEAEERTKAEKKKAEAAAAEHRKPDY